MLKLVVQQGQEDWDEERQEFVYPSSVTLELEHSLVTLSKWESIWEKPFLGSDEKTTAETLDYIRIMCATDIDPDVFESLTGDHLKQVNDYINAKMSATWFTEAPGSNGGPKKGPIITSEILYYWIFSAEIDAKVVETWHLSRLFTLLKVFNEKNAPPKKMNKRDALSQRRMLNEQRKTKMNTTG